jgi:hypothetical protein
MISRSITRYVTKQSYSKERYRVIMVFLFVARIRIQYVFCFHFQDLSGLEYMTLKRKTTGSGAHLTGIKDLMISLTGHLMSQTMLTTMRIVVLYMLMANGTTLLVREYYLLSVKQIHKLIDMVHIYSLL